MSTEVALIKGSATNAATSPRMITSEPATETFHVEREVWRARTTLPDARMAGWASAPRKCYVARIARPAPRLTVRDLLGPCDLARRLPQPLPLHTAALAFVSFGVVLVQVFQIPVPPCCLGVLLAVVLPAVWPVFSNLAVLIFRRVCEGSPSLLVVLIS